MVLMEELLWRLAVYAPLFVVWIVGIVVSQATWRKHPQVSLLAFVGFVIQLFQSGAAMLFNYWMTGNFTRLGWSSQQMGTILNISAVVQTSLSAVAWTLILLAIFRWRSQPNRILGHDGQYLPEGFATRPGETIQRGDADVFIRRNP